MKEVCQDINELQRNLEAMAERFPIAANNIQSAEFPTDRRVVEGKTGLPVYQVLYKKQFINLTSIYNPIDEAKKQVMDHNAESSEVILIFGEAGCYHVEAALAKAKENSKVILISTNPGNLKLVLSTRDLSNVFADERFLIGVSNDETAIHSLMERVLRADMYRLLTFTWIIHPVEGKLQSEVFSNMERLLHNTIHNALFNFNTTAYFEKSWSENFLFNIPRLISGVCVSAFQNSWQDKPVVIVGAGPSLNKNVQLLPEFQDKALILCTDTAYRALQANHIKPSAIVTIDGGTANLRNMNNCNYEDVPVVMDVYTHWQIAAGSRVPPAVFVSHDLHHEWWKKLRNNSEAPFGISTGGSVATTAFSFAKFIGANPIILIGEDLSFPNGEVYANGTINEGKTLDDVRKERQLFPVEDSEGNTLYTTADYLYYLRWFETQVKTTKNRCINATEGGALHKGFEIKTLMETLVQDCSIVQPTAQWNQQFKWNDLDDSDVQEVGAQLNRSIWELRFYARVLNVLLKHAVDLLNFDEKSDCILVAQSNLILERGHQILGRLNLASAFLDAYSFKTITEDIRLGDQLQNPHEEVTKEEHVKRSIQQSIKLFRELMGRCKEAIEMHKGALQYYNEWFNLEQRS